MVNKEWEYDYTFRKAEQDLAKASEGLKEKGWLTKSIINKFRNKSIERKKREIELLKLDIEKAKLNKELKEIKK